MTYPPGTHSQIHNQNKFVLLAFSQAEPKGSCATKQTK